MTRRTLRRWRTVAVGLGLLGASAFTTVPVGGCEGALKVLLEEVGNIEPGEAVFTPQIPLPPPQCNDGWDTYDCESETGDATPISIP